MAGWLYWRGHKLHQIIRWDTEICLSIRKMRFRQFECGVTACFGEPDGGNHASSAPEGRLLFRTEAFVM